MSKIYTFLLLINIFCGVAAGQIKLNIVYSKSGLLYRGVNNKISFDSVACKNVSFASNNSKLYMNSGWMECYPNSLEPVTIIAKTKGANKKAETFTFEVKKPPTEIGLRWGNIHLRDTVKKVHLLLVDKLIPFYSNDFFSPSVVKSYTLEAGGFSTTITGDLFSNEIKSVIRTMQIGGRIKLMNIIVAGGPSFCDYKIGDIDLIIN